RDKQHSVKPPWTKKSRVHDIGPIGCRDDDDVPQLFKSVHLGQELADDPLRHVGISRAAPTNRRDRIDLVKEDDARRCLAGFPKYLSDCLLRLSNILVEELRTLYADEVRLALVRSCLCKKSLPSPWGTVQ